MIDSFDQFIARYGNPDGDPLIKVGEHISQWPVVVIRFGEYVAAIQCCGVTARDEQDTHLSLVVHAFVGGRAARAGAFGTEQGARYTAFDHAPGTSHGWPAVAGLTVLIGHQDDTDRPAQPFTVIGVWDGDEPVPVGVIPGEHNVFDKGVWSATVTATDPHTAQRDATAAARGNH